MKTINALTLSDVKRIAAAAEAAAIAKAGRSASRYATAAVTRYGCSAWTVRR